MKKNIAAVVLMGACIAPVMADTSEWADAGKEKLAAAKEMAAEAGETASEKAGEMKEKASQLLKMTKEEKKEKKEELKALKKKGEQTLEEAEEATAEKAAEMNDVKEEKVKQAKEVVADKTEALEEKVKEKKEEKKEKKWWQFGSQYSVTGCSWYLTESFLSRLVSRIVNAKAPFPMCKVTAFFYALQHCFPALTLRILLFNTASFILIINKNANIDTPFKTLDCQNKPEQA